MNKRSKSKKSKSKNKNNDDIDELDRVDLFEVLRSEIGLRYLITSTGIPIDDKQNELLSTIVDGLLSVNPGGKGRELALKNLVREIAYVEERRKKQRYEYLDGGYNAGSPLLRGEMIGLDKYSHKLQQRVIALLKEEGAREHDRREQE